MSPSFSLRSLLAYAGGLFSQVPSPAFDAAPAAVTPLIPGSNVEPYVPLSAAPSCPLNGPMSCHNNTPVAGDACCFVHPGGRMLLTQFWDQKVHAGGAEEDWTLHGLWPDNCDGSYDTYCNMAPQFNNITEVLERHGQQELLRFMDRYWVASYGANSRLWSHEYNKHATCINTLAPACYASTADSTSTSTSLSTAAYAPGIEAVDYFSRAAALFKTLDTYRALEVAGIVPHRARHYPLEDVRAALETFSGGRVVLRCSGRGGSVLHEVWYVYFLRGSLQTGTFVPAQDLARENEAANCAPWVRYLPKVARGHEL